MEFKIFVWFLFFFLPCMSNASCKGSFEKPSRPASFFRALAEKLDKSIRDKNSNTTEAVFPSFYAPNPDYVKQMVSHFSDLESKNQIADPSILKMRYEDFVQEAMEDLEHFKKQPSDEDLFRYTKLNQVVSLLSSEVAKPQLTALAKHILKLERSERYYAFQELELGPGALFDIERHQLSNPEKIEKQVLELYEFFIKKWNEKINNNFSDYAESFNTFNLYGQIGWKARHEDARPFLQNLYHKNFVIGSYYYALNLVESHIEKGRGSLYQAREVLDTIYKRILDLSLNSKKIKRKAYYADKLMKILLLRSYVYYESFLKNNEKYSSMNKNQKQERSLCSEKCTEYKSISMDSILFYLVLSKYSGVEDVFEEKYRLSSKGIHEIK